MPTREEYSVLIFGFVAEARVFNNRRLTTKYKRLGLGNSVRIFTTKIRLCGIEKS